MFQKIPIIGHWSIARFLRQFVQRTLQSKDKTIKLWDIDSGICEKTFEGHTLCVYSIAFSHCGKKLASGSLD